MSRPTAWSIHLASAVVGVTGLAYAWFLYFHQLEDEFGPIDHPLQAVSQYWHVLLAPLLVFVCGLVWRAHVWGRISGGNKRRRRSGILLALFFAPMVVSGYLCQITVDELWRDAWVVLHVGSSVVWLLVYLGHQLTPAATAVASNNERQNSR